MCTMESVRIFVQQRDGRLRDVILHQRLEQRRFRAESAEDGDFVDSRFDGEYSGGCPSEAVLLVHAFGCVEDAISDFHRVKPYEGPDSNASTYLLSFLFGPPAAFRPASTSSPDPPAAPAASPTTLRPTL